MLTTAIPASDLQLYRTSCTVWSTITTTAELLVLCCLHLSYISTFTLLVWWQGHMDRKQSWCNNSQKLSTWWKLE